MSAASQTTNNDGLWRLCTAPCHVEQRTASSSREEGGLQGSRGCALPLSSKMVPKRVVRARVRNGDPNPSPVLRNCEEHDMTKEEPPPPRTRQIGVYFVTSYFVEHGATSITSQLVAESTGLTSEIELPEEPRALRAQPISADSETCDGSMDHGTSSRMDRRGKLPSPGQLRSGWLTSAPSHGIQ